jgi:hypothetical protein
MDRHYWQRYLATLDPAIDYHEMYRVLVAYEFPWDFNQSLSFALFRTYAVPSIGSLLHRTGEMCNRAQRRYDDTVILLDTILEHSLEAAHGRDALRRINQMHGAYQISNDDLRYVLATFVVMPDRWIEQYGWRPLNGAERTACANYYRNLGRHMGIRDIPETFGAFANLLDRYETDHFAKDVASRAVADATLQLFTTFPLNRLAPRWLVNRFAYAVMDDRLLNAFGYPHPSRIDRTLARAALRIRGRYVRTRPPRMQARYSRQMPQVRSYPDGYDVNQLGTFPERDAPGRAASEPARATPR